jgi:hypothetical protein
MVMDAIMATVVDRGQAQAVIDINIEAGRNIIISHLLYNFILKPSMTASSNPFQRGSRGWCVFIHRNHAAGEANGSIMVGMFV